MEMIKYFCDRCKSEMEKERFVIHYGDLKDSDNTHLKHICENCYKELGNWILRIGRYEEVIKNG